MCADANGMAIEVTDLSKVYHTYPNPRHRLLEILSGGKKRYYHETRALDGVTISLEKGDRLGVVGENGSGKSTLLKILSGVLTPTSGTAKVHGRVSALLELGAGFNGELSGRENIAQFCMLHGLRRDETDAAVPEIIKFSELKDAIEHPVKTYSSGMAVRLGFSCAVYVQPEILIVDEALSVGDAYFQNKCLHKIRSMLDKGTTFVYVTHAADAVKALCNKGLWLEHGKMRMVGAAEDVGAKYQSEMFSRMMQDRTESESKVSEPPAKPMKPVPSVSLDDARRESFLSRVAPLRTGSGEIRIEGISLVDEEGNESDSFPLNGTIRARVFFRVHSTPPQDSALSMGITDSYGREVIHFSSTVKQLYASKAAPHIEHMMEFVFPNPLCPGQYGIIAGIATVERHPQNMGLNIPSNVVDYCAGGARFSIRFPEVEGNYDLWGVVHVNYEVTLQALD